MSAVSAPHAFDDDPARYDALVDWPRRLANETPFYQRLFEQVGVRSVLDAACGTGHHARMFHSWGLQVEGADVSPAMIAHCRTTLGESDTLRWVVRSFDQPPAPGMTFDAVVCVGNSLALAPDVETAHRAVAAMLAALTPGGVCVIQVLNLWHLPDGPTVWQKCIRLTRAGADRVLLKGVRRTVGGGFVELVELELPAEGVKSRFDSAPILALEADDLMTAARRAGASEARVYGTFHQDAYDRQRSPDLILICRRAQ